MRSHFTPMVVKMSLIDRLKSFNRKERFILLHHVLGYEGKSFLLGNGFRDELARKLGVKIPDDAFVAMDYHIDWLQMATTPVTRIVPNDGLVDGNQEDIDLLIAFEAGGKTHVVLVEAKGDTSWSNDQLNSKAARFRRIFGESRNGRGELQRHFVLMSPKKSERIAAGGWPAWMKDENGKPYWIQLPMREDLVKPVRCREDGKVDRDGGYVKIAPVNRAHQAVVRSPAGRPTTLS